MALDEHDLDSLIDNIGDFKFLMPGACTMMVD